MPNTSPTVDSAPILRSLREAARREARIPVGFMASVTTGLHGDALTEMAELQARPARSASPTTASPSTAPGCCARRCSTRSSSAGSSRCTRRTRRSRGKGVMHEGEVSARLGLAGIPSISESTLIARDAAIARYEDGRIHIQHLSARESVEAIAEAKARGVKITCEASPHHLTLTDEALLERARHAAEDEPAAALRGRPPGADRRPADRHDRLHRHRPRAARARGEGGAVRGGADGHDRPGDRVRRGLHGPGQARRPAARAGRARS